jgi:putative ABC transport system substrate-binding protein
VIVASGGTAPAFAAKAASTTIPVVFIVAQDPVRLGLVPSLARPGGNLTGINLFIGELAAKRLEFLHAMVPNAMRVVVLIDPAEAGIAETAARDTEATARAMGLQIQIVNANTIREIDAVFATLGRGRPDALFVSTSPVFTYRRVQFALLAAHHSIPATYSTREMVEAGGLMSYGTSLRDAWRQVGLYTGRILKGAKPADLPVVQPSKFELVINAQTARMLGLTVPDKLLVAADDVIE